MLAKVFSCALIGLEGAVVEVEADLNPRSLPSVTLVGLPDAAVKESTERVRAAIFNSGLTYPRGRLTINLAPADLWKEGPAYDLPIAAALLALSGQLPAELDDALFVGELSLDGSVRHVNFGQLPIRIDKNEAVLAYLGRNPPGFSLEAGTLDHAGNLIAHPLF